MDIVSYCTERVKCGYVQPLCVYSPRRKSVVIIKPSITLESGKNLFFAFSLIDWLRQPLTSSLAGLKLTEITCLCLHLHTPHTWVSFSLFDSLRLARNYYVRSELPQLTSAYSWPVVLFSLRHPIWSNYHIFGLP